MNPIQKAEMLPVEEYFKYIRERTESQLKGFVSSTQVTLTHTINVPYKATLHVPVTKVFRGNSELAYVYPDYNIIDKFRYNWRDAEKQASKLWSDERYTFLVPMSEAFSNIVIKSVAPDIEFMVYPKDKSIDREEFSKIYRLRRYRVINEVIEKEYYLFVKHGDFKCEYPLNSKQLAEWTDISRTYADAINKLAELHKKLEGESHAITLLNKLSIPK